MNRRKIRRSRNSRGISLDRRSRLSIANRFRIIRLEPLEERTLLDGSGLSTGSNEVLLKLHGEHLSVSDDMNIANYDGGVVAVPDVINVAVPDAIDVANSRHILENWTDVSNAAFFGPKPHLELSLERLQVQSAARMFPSIDTSTFDDATLLANSLVNISDVSEIDVEREALSRWYRLELPPDVDVDEAVARLSAIAEVEYVEPNFEWNLSYEIPKVIEGVPDATTDPGYGEQWYHTNVKDPNAWIHLNENGVYPGGDHSVVVAVIDSGVDYNHEELAANMWTNPGEIPGNAIDDDGNGFVDDIHGVSVVSNPQYHTGDPIDLHGHGTHVSGIIAAQGFNDVGGVGVAFNVQIMAIRAAQYSGALSIDDIAEGILYAADNGAEVINMSFGGYLYSQVIVDALEVALNQAVLVAAAGNDGRSISNSPSFPAALPWVLGVEASNPQDGPAWFTNTGYEVRAPGVGIYSTLPGDNYAPWSGTSMAAPVVSGIAALMRSYFWQRDVYSSRFIMGSIQASGGQSGLVDAYRALTEPPKPGVSLYQTWIFDDPEIDPANDGDGRADAGETIHIGFELINRSGQADHVFAILDAIAPSAALPDPYVDIIYNTVIMQGIGPFAMDDNGLIYDNEGVITGVEAPWVVKISEDCPNDHVIPFLTTVYFEDGWDPEHPIYMRLDRFSTTVQQGVNLPSVISEDTTLTSNKMWIVGGPVLIEPGATLTIEAGTQVQWGAVSSDPYNPGPQAGNLIVRGALRIEGTEEDPVELFPSYLVAGQRVDISVESGDAKIHYANVRNPYLDNFTTIDHAFFEWDSYASKVDSWYVTNSIFHKFRGGGDITARYGFDTCLFDAGHLSPPIAGRYDISSAYELTGNVFLQDNENNAPISLQLQKSYSDTWFEPQLYNPVVHDGNTYTFLHMSWNHWTSMNPSAVEVLANYYGGSVASLHSAEEEAFLSSLPAPPGPCTLYLGLSQTGDPNVYTWSDGTPVDYLNWAEDQPPAVPADVAFGVSLGPNGWVTSGGPGGGIRYYYLKIPGEHTTEELNAPLVSGDVWNYFRENYEGDVTENALLSKYWDPNINHWMRVFAPAGTDGYVDLKDNYLGTASTTLIDHMIVDYYDNFVTAPVDYGVPSIHGSESAYPFVESVHVDGVSAVQVPMIGAGPATFDITFNRDMAPSVQPFVTFGPSAPHTDFAVHPTGMVDAEFIVTLSHASDRLITVGYTTQDGTALADLDFVATSGTLTFQPGETVGTIPVHVMGDIFEETDKTFSVVLSDPVVATIADAAGTGTILDDDPTLSIDDVTIHEGDAGTLDAVFNVTLSAPALQASTVDFETQDGDAIAGIDYELVAGTLTFAAGETSKTIAVPIIGDVSNEPDKTFSVRLTHPSTVNIADSTGEALIQDNDFLLSINDVRHVEGDAGSTDAVFTVVLSGESSQTVTVDYTTSAVSATQGVDYQSTSGTLTFLPGETEQTTAVPVSGDTDVEVNETFVVDLSTPSGAAIATVQGLGTIIGDDGFLLSVDDVSVIEGDSGATNLVFTVNLSGDPASNVTVDYATEGASAKQGIGFGSDYNQVAGTLTFTPSGALQQTISVPVNGDVWPEGDEDFFLNLSNGTVAIADHQAIGTITSDDAIIEINDIIVVEGDTGSLNADFTVRLIDWTGAADVTVDYAAISGTALAGDDFTPTSGTLTFLTGGASEQIVSVPILGELVDEFTESFPMRLADPVGASLLDYEATATIQDNDDPLLSIDDVILVEGDAGNADAVFTVTLAAASADVVTVDYATQDGSADASDYSSATGVLQFEPGELEKTLVVSVQGDEINEYDETFLVNISNASGASISDSQGLATITDNDGPSLSIADSDLIEGDSGSTICQFVVTLSESSPETVTIDYDFADATAASSDYSATAGTLTFAPTVTTQTIDVTIHGDTDVEPNETYLVNLSNASHAVIANAQATGTIIGDDGPLLSISDVVLDEGDSGTQNLQLTVTLSEATAGDVLVNYGTSDGTTVSGEDYSAVSGVILIPSSVLTGIILVPILGDTAPEGDESFFMNISSSDAAVSDSSGEATIACDDPTLSIDDVSITESDTGYDDLTFTVSISQRPVATKSVSVDYATAAGSATEGSDYLLKTGSLTFTSDPGDPLVKTVVVQVQGDPVNEIHENFYLDLSNATNAEIEKDRGEAVINDNDGAKFVIADASLTEGDSGTTQLNVTISLTEAASQQVQVDFATEDGTALAGTDYESQTGTVTFEIGETTQIVSIPTIGDILDELDETILVNLSNPIGGVPILDDAGEATILDDETAALSIDDVAVDEGYEGWINSRTWQGTFWITPMTGESYHLLRISGAAAQDDPWLVSGYDVGRFRFQVKTMGIAAMTLQATGQEGAVGLSWSQDDFDLLAGYHLYRSTTSDGTYERINESIIPVGQESFLDGNVTPAEQMYYKFTVVTTDMTESDYSNTAMAAAIDTIAPVLTHVPKTTATAGLGLRLTATVTDNVSVDEVQVYYRTTGSGGAFTNLAMNNLSGDEWSVTIPGSFVEPPGLEYYIIASDGISHTFDGTAAAPHFVVVSSDPILISVSPNVGSSGGGNPVTLTGTLFQNGASVLFGGVPATDVIVVTSSQITCATPPHFPAFVDIAVVNPDSFQADLVSGYKYVDTDVIVSMPEVSADFGEIITIPLSVSQVDAMLSLSALVTFDSSVISLQSVETGPLTFGWAIETSSPDANTVTIALAGSSSVTGTGDAARLNFNVVGAATSQSPLTIVNAEVNDDPASSISSGSFTVNGYHTLSGTISYFGGGTVPGTILDLVGVGQHQTASSADGTFSLSNLQTGAYLLTPDKDDDVSEMTAYDASLVLQSSVGARTLTPNETIAADVNKLNGVTSLDASYILQKSVGLINVPFQGAGAVWEFTPANLSYPEINADLTNQNFTGILIGDVSGSWTAPAQGGDALRYVLAGVDGDAGQPTLTVGTVEGRMSEQVIVPLEILRDGTDVFAIDAMLSYDPLELNLIEATVGGAGQEMSLAVNGTTPGEIQIGLASGTPLASDGELLELRFEVLSTLATPALIEIQTARVNEVIGAALHENGTVHDDTPPDVVNIAPLDGTRISTGTSYLDVTFSEAVIGVDATDLNLSGTAGGSIGTPVDLGGNQWRFPIASLTAGNLSISLVPMPGDITDVAANNLANTQWSYDVGDDVILDATTGDDTVRIWPGTPGGAQHRVQINGVDYYYDASIYDEINVDGLAGTDTLNVYGKATAENAAFNATSVHVSESTVYDVFGQNFENIYVFSGGGTDAAQMLGSVGDDKLYLNESYSYLRGNGNTFLNYASAFDSVSANVAGSGGTDSTYAYDSVHDDIVIAGETQATIDFNATVSPGVNVTAQGFGRVDVYGGNGGTDQATLYGSAGDDSLTGRETYSYVTGNGGAYVNFVKDFDTIVADVSTGGGSDTAVLVDSNGNDRLDASQASVVLDFNASGPSDPNITATGFPSVNVYALKGGDDEAYFTGSAGNDRFTGRDTYGKMKWNSAASNAYASGFDYIEADLTGSGGTDIANLYDASTDDKLVAGETEASFDYAATGVSTPDLVAKGFDQSYSYATSGGTDQAILTGSAGNDRFTAKQTYGNMKGPTGTFFNYATGFDHVIGDASVGAGTDKAVLYDSATNDLLTADPTQATLDYDTTVSPGVDVTAQDFDEVYVYSQNGGTDMAVLTGSAGADRFTAQVAFSYLKANDNSYYNYVNGFDAVTANAVGSGDLAFMYGSDGDDVLNANSLSAAFTLNPTVGTPVVNTAAAFDQVYSYASGDGTDRAYLNGTTGADTFAGDLDWGYLRSTGTSDYFNYVRYFDEVFADPGDADTGNDLLDVRDITYTLDTTPGNGNVW